MRTFQDPGSWNVRLEPSQLNTGLEHKQRGWLVRKHSVGAQGYPDMKNCSHSSLDHQGHLIKTDTHYSQQSQELHSKLGVRIWRGGTSSREQG